MKYVKVRLANSWQYNVFAPHVQAIIGTTDSKVYIDLPDNEFLEITEVQNPASGGGAPAFVSATLDNVTAAFQAALA